MKSEYSEKMTLKYPPCQQPERSCVDYDYDPCESSDDITEKDLAILLKEEAKLREERAAAEAENLGGVQELLEDKRNLTESRKPVKKCKKAFKNPFFNNRLDFSTCLPPPPPTPPPQFFPTFDEDEDKCKGKLLGRQRKKKCKKIKAESQEEIFEEVLEDLGQEIFRFTSEEEEEFEAVPTCRRKCKKIYRPLCRKRSSEISNPFQPRQIPARQRDIPQTSPLEMPEVERQILLSCKNDCKADCRMNTLRKKCKRERQSSEMTIDD